MYYFSEKPPQEVIDALTKAGVRVEWVHTVFIIKNADGTISVYNDKNGCVTTTTYKSIEHYIQSGEYTPIVYYEIS